ncbi:DM13 domain-containing protein [Flectobacillus roseus]|uniref:DM13 domain-containing protein n=1 Tax=Flectobacillus roseus TaxID=502259 RepID=A0ABT6YCD0_9BACT|nr:DM13 domain-containing protein [Flectobacillus roseus]MDI9861195.1 DM13 domain-containing protein [Flectobacillus roseus]MDI9870826.1 DM13 domain-containing protein [Flectobacillus roseus]
MTKYVLLWLCVGGWLVACTQEVAPVQQETSSTPQKLDSASTKNFTNNKKLVLTGNFMNAVHQTSGIAKIYADSAQKSYTLVLENFKTDAGPDLRVYLAEDRAVTNFIQISDKVQNGNIIYDISGDIDFKKRNHVLIWCKSFSVLFGVAELK